MSLDVFTWAGRITAGAVATLGPLRLMRGLQATRSGEDVWVRGPGLKRSDEDTVRRIPWEARYEVLEGNRLRRTDRYLPEGVLPSDVWIPLPDFLRLRLDPPVSAGHLSQSTAVTLRPDSVPREPNLLEASTQDWLMYVQTAPEIRLQRLAFALNEKEPGVVLIRGVPLPPLPGAYFVEAEFVATPAGYAWWPAVSSGTLRKALGVDESDLIVLRSDGTCIQIPRSAWVAASRSTVRLMLSPELYV